MCTDADLVLRDDDTFSEISDIGSQCGNVEDVYTLQDINEFLDVTFGRNIEVKDFFPDVDKFIHTVKLLHRNVSYEALSTKKRFRLKKMLTKLRKDKASVLQTSQMFKSHGVNIFFCLFFLFLFSLYFFLSMELLRVGSLNINGGRDGNKLAMISELFSIKKVNIAFLQETHTNLDNESEWNRWWEGKSVLSHGTNISAGIAILFSKEINVNILAVEEIVKGRILLLKMEYEGSVFVLINVYAPNNGPERLRYFLKLRNAIQKIDDNVVTIIGGDWNCTVDFITDRNGEEPHHGSSFVLSNILKEFELIDIWRRRNIGIKQYTWLKVSNSGVSGARLDRFYIRKEWNNKITDVSILPVGFSDHHLILFGLNMKRTSKPNYFWHFNTKLLQDVLFCENFNLFWNDWKLKKDSFENLCMWWEVGKANIRIFLSKL